VLAQALDQSQVMQNLQFLSDNIGRASRFPGMKRAGPPLQGLRLRQVWRRFPSA
jgi:hypothetical protein